MNEPLLLTDPSPCLRWLVLRDLLGRDESDPELAELAGLRAGDRLVTDVVSLQDVDGAWRSQDLAASTPAGDASAGQVRGTALALMRLGYLGFGSEHPAVRAGAERLFAAQRADGAWELHESGGSNFRTAGDGEDEATGEPEGYSMIPLQTAIPLRALAACGYATDARAERAYDWLLTQRLPDGAWPTGIAAGNYGRVGGYRRLAHSRWGCRSNTTGALVCLAHHPVRRQGAEARRALDLLLGRETHEQEDLGFEVARLTGLEPFRGRLTFYARFDLALLLDLCGRTGATRADERVAELIETVQSFRGPYGLWDYPPRPQAARWVTFDLLRSLARIDPEGEWQSQEPRTPFQNYPRRVKRY